MKDRLTALVFGLLLPLAALAQRDFTPAEARRMFDEKYEMVFGSRGSTLYYAVNIIGLFRTEGTIWYKQRKSKFMDEKYTAWNDGTTYYRVERSKKTVTIFDANDEGRDKYAGKFSFEPDNYDYAARETADQYIITLKARRGVKGVKEASCYISKQTGYPESLRIKVLFFSTTIKITNFASGNISDDLFTFPESLYADYRVIDKRK